MQPRNPLLKRISLLELQWILNYSRSHEAEIFSLQRTCIRRRKSTGLLISQPTSAFDD